MKLFLFNLEKNNIEEKENNFYYSYKNYFSSSFFDWTLGICHFEKNTYLFDVDVFKLKTKWIINIPAYLFKNWYLQKLRENKLKSILE